MYFIRAGHMKHVFGNHTECRTPADVERLMLHIILDEVGEDVEQRVAIHLFEKWLEAHKQCGNTYPRGMNTAMDKWEDFKAKYLVILPWYLYEHGGIVFSTHKSDKWDCGKLGYIFMSKNEYALEWRMRGAPDASIRENTENHLRQILKRYEHFVCEMTKTGFDETQDGYMGELPIVISDMKRTVLDMLGIEDDGAGANEIHDLFDNFDFMNVRYRQ